jgi:exosortase
MAPQSRRISKPAGEGAARLESPSDVGGTIPERQTASPLSARKSHSLDVLTGRARPGPRAGLIILVMLGLLAGLYGGILRDLAWQWWNDPNYAHGFLVPLFSGLLVWQRRKQLAALPANGSWIGLPVLLAGVGALLLGEVGAELFLMRSSLIVILAGLVLFHLGRESFQVLAFPLLFLFFMVPLPATLFYAVAFPLQSLAARNAAWMLDALGVPVLLDGNVIHLAKQSLGVAEACSGIRSLISLFSVAVAWAALTLPGIFAMAAFLAAVVPITILANGGRVVITGLIGQWFGVEYAEGFFHTLSSWLVFVFAFVCLVGIHSLIRLVQSHWQKRAP